jgi:hypothetical protein
MTFIGFSAFILFFSEIAFIFTHKEVAKYLVKNGRHPINVKGGGNFNDFDILTFLRTFKKNKNNSKLDRNLLKIIIIQVIIRFGIIFSWLIYAAITILK